MRWQANKRAQAQAGRVVTRFAFLPTKVGIYWVWMEHYESRQVCHRARFGWVWYEVGRRLPDPVSAGDTTP